MAFLPALLGGLLTIAASMVGRVLLALGLSFITYQGFDLAVDWLFNDIKTNIGAMPVEVASFLGYLWIDRALSMIFAAYTVALGIKMLGGSSITKLVTKAPGV